MKKVVVIVLMLVVVGGGLWVVGKQQKTSEQESLTQKESVVVSTPVVKNIAYNPTPITLDSIFSSDKKSLTDVPSDKVTTVIVTGDVMLGRSVNTRNLKYDFTWPFEKVKNLLSSADITFINLESPIVEDCQPTDEGMYFCADPKSGEGLVSAGVDVATVANNHATNYGEKGLRDTVRYLNENSIKVTGVTNYPAIVTINGKKVAFLGYNDVGYYEGINNSERSDNSDFSKLSEDIKQTKSNSDIVIVQFHFGNEYQYEPTARQKELARKSIDAGADLVVGNHPHWFQGLEIYKGKLIAYSHGNLVFDQMWSEETKTGIVGKYTFYDNQLIDAEFFPVYIENFGQPRVLEGEEKESVLLKLKQISKSI